MYEILKLIQDTLPQIIAQNPEGFKNIQILQFNQNGPGSMVVRHTDQPNADFHFVPGSGEIVLVNSDHGPSQDLYDVNLIC